MSDLKYLLLPLLLVRNWFWRALALGVANRVWMLENSIYAVLSQKALLLSCGRTAVEQWKLLS